ncbi:hypothetical protein QM012_000592 [Aureobasidium pullulans]|uniref:DUF625-domain-containing protein n=1 Tax=Aureobasidium pullulans TaxID=5580 RepID=A0ABR0TW34_AURPU
MALAAPPLNDRKRVKVYELKNNDWFDRGTGFCAGQLLVNDEARIFVQSEDDAQRMLLETRISRDDGYQRQQDTLIVWTEPSGIDMALSFQEADGCAQIWEFITDIQQRMLAMHPNEYDGLSDELVDGQGLLLPMPELANLHQVQETMRAASQTTHGRDALVKFIMAPETQYLSKLLPLVELAEHVEDIQALHRLCTIMKTLILLNDTSIIELTVSDHAILGVVGALEYDPDFPSHKANHRHYLADESRFKEVVAIDNPVVKNKIHATYRLQYLKDVVLARILDDPTFTVLNSLIFYNQVDIVNHIQSSKDFIQELFAIFTTPDSDDQRKKDAVHFIQTCCSVAKSIQAQSRAHLFQNFIHGGLLDVVTYALRHRHASVRVAGTDILVALIDHDPVMMRSHIFRSINQKTKPLTDTLIELLLVEVDLGVKAQMADAIKVLLDPHASSTSMDMLGRTNGDFMAKMRGANPNSSAQMESFVDNFYNDGAKRLFQPLKDLEHSQNLHTISVHEASLFVHLVEILCFFIRQHNFRSKYYILAENLHCRVAQLLSCPQKHLKLTALKWFRTCVALNDEHHNKDMITKGVFDPILDIVYQTMPRDNLLNSACLELFEFIKRENLKQLVIPLVEGYREKLLGITYVNTFGALVMKYEQIQSGFNPDESSFSTQGGETPNRSLVASGQRWQGLKDADAEEEAYFNATSDDEIEDESAASLPDSIVAKTPEVGPPMRPLVSYPEDEDEDAMEMLAASPGTPAEKKEPNVESTTPDTLGSPLSVVPEKRRREEDDEDDLEKLAGAVPAKRRSSVSSIGSVRSDMSAANLDSPTSSQQQNGTGHPLRRKGSLRSKDDSAGPQKGISIGSISLSLGKTSNEEGGES